jgi:hypothetical protein
MRFPLTIVSRFGSVALLIYGGWLGWDHLGPERPAVGAERAQVADQLIATVVADIRDDRVGEGPAVLVHFGNDATHYVTDRLRAALNESGVLVLRDRTLMEKAVDLLGFSQPGLASVDEAIAEASRRRAPLVVTGRVLRFESGGGPATLEMDVTIARTGDGEVVFSDRYLRSASILDDITTQLDTAGRAFTPLQRILTWVFGVLLLPLAFMPLLRSSVRERSHLENAVTLSSLTIVNGLLGVWLVGGLIGSWWGTVLFAGVLGAGFLYLLIVMAWAMELERI